MANEPDDVPNAPTIWEALDSWAKELSSWQRYIVGKSANQGQLSNEEIGEAYRLFLIDKKLAEKSEGETLPAVPPLLGRPTDALNEKLTLNKISAIKGINALPDDCDLSFSEGLTVVYGQNGAGKTGFSRLISNACFSRQKPEIIGDINADEEVPQSASFHISVGGVEKDPITYPLSDPESPLKRISCFDTAVALHHLTQAAAFEFKPSGFDVFPEIGRVYGVLESKLQEDIDAKTAPNEFPSLFAGPHGPVYEAMVTLGADSNLEEIRKLAVYGKTESDRIDAIEKEVIALASKASKDSIENMWQAKSDIETLAAQITKLEGQFDQTAVDNRAKLITEARDTAAAAVALGSDKFKRPFFEAVGSQEWQTFVQGAHALAKKEGANYPMEGSKCLLCEQELGEGQRLHISSLLAYVEGAARQAAEKAAAAVRQEIVELKGTDVNIFLSTSRVRSHVNKIDTSLEALVDAAVNSISTAKAGAIDSLEQLKSGAVPLTASNADVPLKATAASLQSQIDSLTKSDVEAATKKLDDEKRTLRHKQVLSQNLVRVESYVANAKWVRDATAAKSSLNTLHVTNKEKTLSDQIIGDSYRARFSEECTCFDCDVPVELKTAGRSGRTLHSLVIKGGHRVEDILSEGEQKAVAIADFLTEVSLNPATAGIVLDDPVSSLDDLRKGRIAKRLVEEAKVRQVIVFTHDFVFLNQLSTLADEIGVPMLGHWVERDGTGRPGHVASGDLPVTSKVYQTTQRAEESLARANNLSGSEREKELKHGSGCLRTTLEETVVRRMFKGIVPRWSDRVIVTALGKVNWDNTRADEIVRLYEELSGMMEGHSKTDEAHGVSLEPKHLKEKIEKVQEIIKWAKLDRVA